MTACSHPMAGGCRWGVMQWLIATVAAALPATSLAQAILLDEVVVTARRVSESLAEVPLSIVVIGRTQLDGGYFDGLRSLATRVPGLYYETMWGGMGSAAVLRGQSQPNTAGDNVGVFVDGVYQAARNAIDVQALDIERVEIVRGPQSTLFGHSTFAGAIHYVMRRPTRTLESGVTLDAGTDEYLSGAAFLSGPLPGQLLSGRLALSVGSFAGTEENHAVPGQSLGGYRRRAAAAMLSTNDSLDWSAILSARASQVEATHPAAAPLTYRDYNCGSQDPVSGAWSYFCGRLPVATVFEVSPGMPDSVSDTWQMALNLSLPLAGLKLESDTSFYSGSSRAYRDFDATDGGELFGVCMLAANCTSPSGAPLPVTRLVLVNEVAAQSPSVEEFSQEFRLLGRGWMVGLTGFVTREVARGAMGVDGSVLGSAEQLTAYLPATPLLAGPLSNFNRALVTDLNAAQVEQALTRSERQTLALFGAVDLEFSPRLRARGELRATLERLEVNNVTANFRPGFGRAIEPQDFFDLTPRLSLEYWPGGATNWYASAARGSRSGGINPIPGLLPEEQGYEPETNWTYEVSGRHTSAEGRLQLIATAFYIDWDNVQISGFSNTPGIGNLITSNTGGVTTRGVELSVSAELLQGLQASLDYSYADPRFRAGSDDPGSSRFCGLSGSNTTSTFCTLGPPRHPGTGSVALVPYVDDNRLQRAPTGSWHLALAYLRPVGDDGMQLTARIDAAGQDDVFDRAIGGARYGARTLVDARLGLARGRWSIEMWGLNLSDERYISAAASRGAVFFPTTPRPLDLLVGPGRRFGVTFMLQD